MYKKFYLFLSILFLSHNNIIIAAIAGGGFLDPSFGYLGTSTFTIGDNSYAYSTALQSNQKIVAAGFAIISATDHSAVTRLDTNGSLDATFGYLGTTTFLIGNSSQAASIAIQNIDQKIVTAGIATFGATNHCAVTRLNTIGSLDSTFGYLGTTTFLIGDYSQANSIAVQNTDQKIITSVSATFGATNLSAVTRLDINGSLDATFGYLGTTTFLIGSDSNALSVAIQNIDQKIIVAGISGLAGAVTRLNTNGSIDTSFGYLGTTTIAFNNGFTCYSAAIQNDHKIVVAGDTQIGATAYFGVTRLNTDGSLDTSFGSNGSTTFFPNAACLSVAIQDDQKIVVAGATTDTNKLAIARLNPDGSLDTIFGSGGTAIITIGSQYVSGFKLCIQDDGKLIVSGRSSNISSVVARLTASGIIIPGPIIMATCS